MRTVEDISELRKLRAALSGSFGLVPTMGALHEGHLSLVRQAEGENDHVGVSIFVNPTQFGPKEDFAKYPRDLDGDLRKLETLGVDLVWIPGREVVYPEGFQTWVSVEHLGEPMEGEHRPGHFRGVATVVAKLFNVFTPDRAYFGEKDAQQVAVIRRLSKDLNFPLEVVVCPTVREHDGLALSSRNSYLSPAERPAAGVLFRALSAAKSAHAAGERDGDRLRATMSRVIASEPLAREDYVAAVDPDTLIELKHVGRRALLLVAVRIGGVRLIDNISIVGES